MTVLLVEKATLMLYIYWEKVKSELEKIAESNHKPEWPTTTTVTHEIIKEIKQHKIEQHKLPTHPTPEKSRPDCSIVSWLAAVYIYKLGL